MVIIIIIMYITYLQVNATKKDIVKHAYHM